MKRDGEPGNHQQCGPGLAVGGGRSGNRDATVSRQELEAQLQAARQELREKDDELRELREAVRESEKCRAKGEIMGRFGRWERDFAAGKAVWSEGVYCIFGLVPGQCEPSYDNFLSLLPAADRENLKKALQAALQGGRPLDAKYRIIRPDGAERIIHTMAEVIGGEDGEAQILSGIVQDVTEESRTEEQLRLNEARLMALLKLYDIPCDEPREIAKFVVENAVRLTGSSIGFVGFIDAAETVMSGHVWSEEAIRRYGLADQPVKFPVEKGSLWAEGIRQRRSIIANDYALAAHKKGYLPGHGEVKCFASVPVVENGHVVAVAGVGNKEQPYDDSDVTQLRLLMEGMWHIYERRKMEEQIRTSLREKETLLRELYHRTKNNMEVICSLLALQAATITDERVLKIFRDTEAKIKAMALVHHKLYQAQDLSRINLGDYINDLAVVLLKNYGTKIGKISLALDMDEIFVLIDTAIPCGLILNELFTNALKYAFPEDRCGEIGIRLTKSGDNETYIRFSDNGVGVPDGFDFTSRRTLGLQTIFNLTERQLRGKVTFEVCGGVICHLRFHDVLYSRRV